MALTKKEKAFCEEYVANGGNASRAYFAAYDTSSIENARKGYCKVFRKPEVKEYIAALQKEAFAAACISAERVALKLADIAFADKDDEIYRNTNLYITIEELENMNIEEYLSEELKEFENIVLAF